MTSLAPSIPIGIMGPTSNDWQTTFRNRLEERQAADSVHAQLIAQYKNLALCLRESRERNKAWLNSKGSAGGPANGGSGQSAEGRSYIITLEKQLSSVRNDLQDLYKSQSVSQARQLAMADTLRERDEEVRRLQEELRVANEARERLSRRDKEWEERWRMKEGDVQTLHDEVLSLTLELNQISHRNVALQADNASLLHRWLDRMNERADAMNETFEKELKVSGKEKVVGEEEKDGEK